MKSKVILAIALCASLFLLAGCGKSGWRRSERQIIKTHGEVLPVYTVKDSVQAAVLTSVSDSLSIRMIKSAKYSKLVSKMIATVKDTTNNGVGIAAPQVGISRRLVVVQRFDKDGEPFEAYPNVRILSKSGDLTISQEGCLSIPHVRGYVIRNTEIDIMYYSVESESYKTEHVSGFTASIFQHEIDHLDGILISHRMKEVKF